MGHPAMYFPLLQTLTHALGYLRALLSSSTDASHWQRLCTKTSAPYGGDHPIAPRWRILIPDKPVLLTVGRASRQLSIERSLLHPTRSLTRANTIRGIHIVLNFAAKGRDGATKHRAALKRKAPTTVKPIRGSNAPGDKVAIHHILARCDPRRIRHNLRSTWVENFLVQ